MPKSRHLGRPIYLNSTSKFEVELALKKWPRPGSIFSDDSVTVITSVLINENIDPGRGPFFLPNLGEKSSRIYLICVLTITHVGGGAWGTVRRGWGSPLDGERV